MLKTMQPIWKFWYNVINRFFDDGCTSHAAALAFTLLLSLVPLLTVGFTIFTFIPVFDTFSDQIQSFIFTHFVPSSGQIIQQYFQHFIAQTTNLSWLGLIFLLITAILTLHTIESSFNIIWQVKKPRSWLKRFFLYWVSLTFVPLLFGISFIISMYLLLLSAISTALIVFTPFLFSTAAFTLLYKTMPSCFVAWRASLLGGLTAAVLFQIAKYSFAWYLIHFPTYELLYGVLATIPIFLTWLYICWLIILFGAEVCHGLNN